MEETERVIGKYTGAKEGPLFICLGGIHGNEPAGVQAIEMLFDMLKVEPLTNPDFEFHGTFIGIRGNLQALEEKVRFMERDLNRSLHPERVKQILAEPPESLEAEDLEIYHMISTIRKEVDDIAPSQVVVLDLHTTTASGGIFILTADDEASISIGVKMHAPVIIGFENMLAGTTMGYFKPENFGGLDVTSVVFESGQHEDPLSVNRAIAGLINCMRAIGCVSADHVENRHDHLLIEYSEGLPKVAKLIERYSVADVEKFEMTPGIENFDQISKGQVLAIDNGNVVRASRDSMIIMPKYQKQGDDGFFLVERQNGATTILSEKTSLGADNFL